MKNLNAKLRRLYEEYRLRGQKLEKYSKRFSPPTLLKVTEEYVRAYPRVIIVGNETFGWDWPGKDRSIRKLYPEWTHQDINCFDDFCKDPDSVGWLMTGYRLFHFAERQPTSRNGLFYRFHRSICTELEFQNIGSVLTTNLFRMDYGGGSVFDEMGPRRVLLAFQHGLLARELDILSPDFVIFVTSYQKDDLLRDELGDLTYTPVHHFSPQLLSCLRFTNRQFSAMRTYHPIYLNFKNEYSKVVSKIGKKLRQTSSRTG